MRIICGIYDAPFDTKVCIRHFTKPTANKKSPWSTSKKMWSNTETICLLKTSDHCCLKNMFIMFGSIANRRIALKRRK